MIASIISVCRLILPGFRLPFAGVVAMSLLVAILEMVGVASVMPLIAVMIDPEGISRNRFVAQLLGLVGMTQTPPVHVVGMITVVLFIFSSLLSFLLSWWSVRFSARLAIALSRDLARSHFRQPFRFFMAHPVAELANQMCNEVAKLASGGILQLCMVFVRIMQLVLTVGLVFVLSPLFTALCVGLIGGIYVVIYRHNATVMRDAGAASLESINRSVQTATEMYGLAREILLRGQPGYFIDRVTRSLEGYYRRDAVMRVLPNVPKYAIETIAICAVFALPIYRSMTGQDVRTDLPLLATFAYAGFRLLPVVQQLYSSLAILKYHQPLSDHIHTLCSAAGERRSLDAMAGMPRELVLRDIHFSYPASAGPALNGVSLDIRRGERIAIIGPSGAGKSTLIDLLLGLLEPQVGQILADGKQYPNLHWQAGAVGYVPQAPFIMNDSILRNVAFGCDDEGIDAERCRIAIERAGLADLVAAQAKGMQAVLGKDVLNFSGGERQRLAIARALYSAPGLMILDEPASALDPLLARRIFEMLCAPALDATVLVVTHDLDHLDLFDKVLFVQQGRVHVGASRVLVEQNADYRAFLGRLADEKRRVP